MAFKYFGCWSHGNIVSIVSRSVSLTSVVGVFPILPLSILPIFDNSAVTYEKSASSVTLPNTAGFLQVLWFPSVVTLFFEFLFLKVSRRWRYLAEDDALWKNKCLQLGIIQIAKSDRVVEL